MTLTDFYQRTGQKLGIVAGAEALSADDNNLIQSTYAGLHDQLLSEGLVSWGPSADIPEWAVDPVSSMLAAMLVDEFGLEEPRRSAIQLKGVLGINPASPAERVMRRQLQVPQADAAVPTTYY